jgi:hypothetical protein
MPQEQRNNQSKELHLSFIEMLFALAIAEVAIQVANLIQSPNSGARLPAYAHLTLATIIIAASWAGWRQSPFGGSEVKTIFSLNFLELLIDVVLVVCYFVLTRSVELPDDKTKPFVASAENECLWVMVIMITYFVWDVVAKRENWGRFFRHVWASFISATLAVISYLWILPRQSDKTYSVILCDASLLSLVLLFRAIGRNDSGSLQRRDKFRIAILFFLWLGFSIGAHVVYVRGY